MLKSGLSGKKEGSQTQDGSRYDQPHAGKRAFDRYGGFRVWIDAEEKIAGQDQRDTGKADDLP